MFEDRDFDQALRHAIPLDDTPSEGRSAPFFGLPGVRDSLRITPGSLGGGGILMHGNYFSHLRLTYEAAAKDLEQRGQLDRAAFVWAELLQEPLRAVDLFERHEKYAKAAEVAEVRGLPPALIVRLWFLAGEIRRAVDLALLSGAFAGAVEALESRRSPRAEELRLLWASSLASGGSWLGAVETLWPLERRRALAKP